MSKHNRKPVRKMGKPKQPEVVVGFFKDKRGKTIKTREKTAIQASFALKRSIRRLYRCSSG